MFICYILYTLYIRGWKIGHLPDIHEALSLISSTRKKNIYMMEKKEEEEKGEKEREKEKNN